MKAKISAADLLPVVLRQAGLNATDIFVICLAANRMNRELELLVWMAQNSSSTALDIIRHCLVMLRSAGVSGPLSRAEHSTGNRV